MVPNGLRLLKLSENNLCLGPQLPLPLLYTSDGSQKKNAERNNRTLKILIIESLFDVIEQLTNDALLQAVTSSQVLLTWFDESWVESAGNGHPCSAIDEVSELQL